MSDEIHSSSWTGPPPPPQPEWERRLLFHGVPTIEELRVAKREARERYAALPPQVQRVRRLAGWLLLSPAVLLVGYWIANAVIPDQAAHNLFEPVILWGLLAFFTAFWQLKSESRSLVLLRQVVIGALLIAMIVGGPLYAYAAIASHAHARPLPRERTFEIYRCTHHCYLGGYFLHQRLDGETIEGEYAGPPQAYGRCATVEVLVGRYGFSWVRVLERMRPQPRELFWPVRREDCFSDKPLSSLKT
jgi:hypothetical protein